MNEKLRITKQEFDKSLQWYFDQGRRIEDMRDDIRLRQTAIDKGFTVKYGRGFAESLTFWKGNKAIWYCRKGWACCEYVNNKACNQRYYEELETALEKEA